MIRYFIVLILVILISCNNSNSDFAGQWKSINSNEHLKIESIGKNYTITTSLWMNEDKIPAVFNKDKDVLEVSLYQREFIIVHDSKNDHLFFLNEEYKRE